jgi:hypothetical protein
VDIPVKLIHEEASRPSAAEIAVGVCVAGQGPFTFLVDTGAATTVVDSGLATRLHLTSIGEKIQNHTFGCNRELSFVSPPGLSVGGVALNPQPITTGTLASPEVPRLQGLIGADILSRFGAVRFDFDHQTITVGPEGDEPSRSVQGTGSTSVVPGTVSAVPGYVHVSRLAIPGDTSQSATFVYMLVQLVIGGVLRGFVVDTGAAQTAVSPALAKASGRLVGQPQTFYGGLSCLFRAQPYVISSWRIGDVSLSPQVVGAAPVPSGWDGLFGSGTLQRYSPVVVDFAHGSLLLGPVHGPEPVIP